MNKTRKGKRFYFVGTAGAKLLARRSRVEADRKKKICWRSSVDIVIHGESTERQNATLSLSLSLSLIVLGWTEKLRG